MTLVSGDGTSTSKEKKALYCEQLTEDGMGNVCSRRCSHVSCTRRPNFDVEGSKAAAYGREHAEGGVVDMTPARGDRTLTSWVARTGVLQVLRKRQYVHSPFE